MWFLLAHGVVRGSCEAWFFSPKAFGALAALRGLVKKNHAREERGTWSFADLERGARLSPAVVERQDLLLGRGARLSSAHGVVRGSREAWFFSPTAFGAFGLRKGVVKKNLAREE